MDNVVRLADRRAAEPRPEPRPEPNRHPEPRLEPNREPEPLWREVIGRQLRTERAERGERIVDVADRAGVAPQYLSEIERGVKDPSSEVLAAVSGALGLSVRELTRRASHQLSAQRMTGPVCLAA